ncbi:MAG: DUF3783 domain-containing protein [Lachnospiraceae bacterium]|nr:DUF3783 domain-containing protein [Lachnospiraceae bacterium]MDE7274681.1 DUF3783 domain-containing protein [Lachnospiraceae bacterium]
MKELPKSMILYYVQDEKKKIQMEVLGMSMSITTKKLKPSDLNTQVGTLAGMKNIAPLDLSQTEKVPAIFCMPEIIIFSGVPDKKLDEFLFSYKKVGLTPTKLKAVTTPKNINWTLYQLIRELSAERAQIEGRANRLSGARKLSEAKKEEE